MNALNGFTIESQGEAYQVLGGRPACLRVQLKNNGIPVEGHPIKWTVNGGVEVTEAMTDRFGFATFDAGFATPGEYSVEAVSNQVKAVFEVRAVRLVFNEPDTAFRLETSGAVQGEVTPCNHHVFLMGFSEQITILIPGLKNGEKFHFSLSEKVPGLRIEGEGESHLYASGKNTFAVNVGFPSSVSEAANMLRKFDMLVVREDTFEGERYACSVGAYFEHFRSVIEKNHGGPFDKKTVRTEFKLKKSNPAVQGFLCGLLKNEFCLLGIEDDKGYRVAYPEIEDYDPRYEAAVMHFDIINEGQTYITPQPLNPNMSEPAKYAKFDEKRLNLI